MYSFSVLLQKLTSKLVTYFCTHFYTWNLRTQNWRLHLKIIFSPKTYFLTRNLLLHPKLMFALENYFCIHSQFYSKNFLLNVERSFAPIFTLETYAPKIDNFTWKLFFEQKLAFALWTYFCTKNFHLQLKLSFTPKTYFCA